MRKLVRLLPLFLFCCCLFLAAPLEAAQKSYGLAHVHQDPGSTNVSATLMAHLDTDSLDEMFMTTEQHDRDEVSVQQAALTLETTSLIFSDALSAPTSMFLFGAGLIAFSVFSRKRMNRDR